MGIETLHVLVEERSMEVTLEALLPRMLRPEVSFRVHPFDCKGDLLKKLPSRLAAYKVGLPPSAMILIVVDRDDGDCKNLKKHLEDTALRAGLFTKSSPDRGHFQVINRIVIEELEAWFFGDWSAVCAAYPKLDPSVPQRAGMRDPDGIRGGTWEAMERELQRKGYFKQGLRKIELARTVAPLMDPSRNRSASFACFRDVVMAL